MKPRNQLVYFTILVSTILIEIFFRKTHIIPDYYYYYLTDILWSCSIFFGFGFLFKKFPTIIIYILACSVTCALDFIRFIPGPNMYIFKQSFIYKLFVAYHYPNRDLLTYVISISFCTFLDVFLTKKELDKKFYNRLKRIGVFIAFSVLVMIIGFDNNIKIQNYEIPIKNLPKNLNGLKIVHVSDLHSTVHGDDQSVLINKIKQLKPDLIVLSGDIADNRTGFLGTQLLLEGIKDVAPMFYCIGNHEIWARDFIEINKKIKAYGVISLENSMTKININGESIYIGGIDDPESYYADDSKPKPSKALDLIHTDKEGLKILLSHRPEMIDLYKKQNYDLIFAGHAHGGQVQVPFLINGLYSPNQGFFPKYAGGVYSLNNKTNLVVSRGLSLSSLPRVFNPPELVFVTLKGM